MGIHGLGKFLAQRAPRAVEQLSADAFMSSVVAIDASTSLYAFMIAIRDSDNFNNLTNSAGESTSHLAGMLTRAIRILELGMKPIYVFDGKPPTMKTGELAKRRDRKAAAQAEMEEARERGDEERVRQLAGRTVRVSKKENEEVKKLLRLMGIPLLEAPGEAECQCAYLCRAGIADAVVSEDADALCFGASKLVRGLTFADRNKGQVTCITLATLLTELELTKEQFIEFCILCGCDYTESLHGVGPQTAFKWIQKHGSIKQTFEANGVDLAAILAQAADAPAPEVEAGMPREQPETSGSGEQLDSQPVSDERTDEDDGRGETAVEKPGEAATPKAGSALTFVIDGRTVTLPRSFPYEEAFRLFTHPDVIGETELRALKFEPGELQEEALVEFLVKENQFNETRVANAITRLKAARRLGAQTRLDTFFKPKAAPAAGKRAAPAEVKKEANKKKRKT